MNRHKTKSALKCLVSAFCAALAAGTCLAAHDLKAFAEIGDTSGFMNSGISVSIEDQTPPDGPGDILKPEYTQVGGSLENWSEQKINTSLTAGFDDDPWGDNEASLPIASDGKRGWRAVYDMIVPGAEVFVTLNDARYVPSAIFRQLKLTGAVMRVQANSTCTWVIDGNDLPNVPIACDLRVTMGTTAITESDLRSLYGTVKRTFSTKSGDLRAKLIVDVRRPFIKERGSGFVNVYRHNEDTGRMDFSVFTVALDGMMELSVTHGGDYAYALDTESMRAADFNNNGVVELDEAQRLLEMMFEDINGFRFEKVDANGDRKFNIKDITLVLRVLNR